MSGQCPLVPQSQPNRCIAASDVTGQSATSAILFDQLVGPRQERSGTSTPIGLPVLRLIAGSNFAGGLITTKVADSSRIVVKHVTVNAD